MSTLYEICDSILDLQSINPGEDEDFAEAVQNSLDDIKMDLYEKLDNTVKLIHENNADVVKIKAEVERLNKRKKTSENLNTTLRGYVLAQMQKLKKKTIKTDFFTISDSIGKEVVAIDNLSDIPQDYVRITMKEAPDKINLLKALKSGETISGCHIERADNNLKIT